LPFSEGAKSYPLATVPRQNSAAFSEIVIKTHVAQGQSMITTKFQEQDEDRKHIM